MTTAPPSTPEVGEIRRLTQWLEAISRGESPLGSPPTNILRRDATSTPEMIELPPSVAAPATPAWPPLPLDRGRTLAPVDVGRAMLLLVTDT
ncbi:MAG: hypothetical protein EI684_10135, partial [Candidatus Viridilinea halotolerans]